jgi:hypothetical protein
LGGAFYFALHRSKALTGNTDIVLNIPDSSLWPNVEAIANKTGKASPLSGALLIRTERGLKFNVAKWKSLYYIFRHYFSVGTRPGHNFRCDE